MRYLWVNIAILIILIAQLISGAFGFTNGYFEKRWILWVHGLGAYTIALALIWKGAVILNAFRRRGGLNLARLAFALMLILLMITLFLGLLWTTAGPSYLFGFSTLTLHIFVAILLAILVFWHVVKYRWIFRTPRVVNRRSFVNYSFVGVGGLLLWLAARKTKSLLVLPGSDRRFTGSFETGSYTGEFPTVSWIADEPPVVDLQFYRLKVIGAVNRPLSLSYEQLESHSIGHINAILDCTGGWFTEQQWRGIPLVDLLKQAGYSSKVESISVRSLTGYERRFSLKESASFILAIGVADNVLSRGHGFPVRLVAPGQRGVNWVKWVESIALNTSSKFLQSPLPLQ